MCLRELKAGFDADLLPPHTGKPPPRGTWTIRPFQTRIFDFVLVIPLWMTLPRPFLSSILLVGSAAVVIKGSYRSIVRSYLTRSCPCTTSSWRMISETQTTRYRWQWNPTTIVFSSWETGGMQLYPKARNGTMASQNRAQDGDARPCNY